MSNAPSRECTKKYEGHLKFKYLTSHEKCSCLRRNIKFRNPPTDFLFHTALAWLMSVPCSVLSLLTTFTSSFSFCNKKNHVKSFEFNYYFGLFHSIKYVWAAQQLLPLSQLQFPRNNN